MKNKGEIHMSDLEKGVLEMEDQQLDEFKSSMGVDAEVPEPTTKEITPPGGEAQKGEVAPQKPTTKVQIIASVNDMMKGLSKEQLHAMYNSMTGKGQKNEEVESTTTSIKEIRKISAKDVDVAEDVRAMFGGEELSEDFVGKATTIFEAAVVSKVNEILETVSIDLEAELEAEKEEIVESMSTRLDDYLEYVTEEWMKENTLAVEQGIRNEIVENFMVGLRNLFAENYIDIPEDKVDLVDELATKVTELESSVNEEMERNIVLRKELIESKKKAVLRDVCEGLTHSQTVKMKSLAEGVDFESAEDYSEKLETIKENYFPSEDVTYEDNSVDEDPVELEDIREETSDPGMRAYMDAITRSIKK
jgi:hypothetical protein